MVYGSLNICVCTVKYTFVLHILTVQMLFLLVSFIISL